MTTQPEDPLVAHTDSPEAAALLRRHLTALADQHRGTAMARRVREVLSGREDLASLETDPEFMRLVRSGVRQYEEHLASLSPEEKERLYAEAHELADRDRRPPH